MSQTKRGGAKTKDLILMPSFVRVNFYIYNLYTQDWIATSTKMKNVIGPGTLTISQKFMRVIINQVKMGSSRQMGKTSEDMLENGRKNSLDPIGDP